MSECQGGRMSTWCRQACVRASSGSLILKMYYYPLNIIIINVPRAPVLIVPLNVTVLCKQRTLPWGNLLVTGVDMFCIFNPGKCPQMESCHPGKWACDLYPPLAQSEWWKVKIRNPPPPGGASAPACEANHSFIPPLFLRHSQKSAESWCRNSLEISIWLAEI